jgi:hypothetical protein
MWRGCSIHCCERPCGIDPEAPPTTCAIIVYPSSVQLTLRAFVPVPGLMPTSIASHAGEPAHLVMRSLQLHGKNHGCQVVVPDRWTAGHGHWVHLHAAGA